MCDTWLIWKFHWKPLTRKFQSFLLHLWSCRDLPSTLNVLISISLTSWCQQDPNLAFCWKQQATACTQSWECREGQMGFQKLFLIICPYTFVLVHMRHSSKWKKGKLILLLTEKNSPGSSQWRELAQPVVFVKFKIQHVVDIHCSVIWSLSAAFIFIEVNCELYWLFSRSYSSS